MRNVGVVVRKEEIVRWYRISCIHFYIKHEYVYINYKINENIDYIAQNSIVDKEETPTSDKETTSEKTPESPEDRLKKLADVKEKGLIDEDEFKSKKEEILKGM